MHQLIELYRNFTDPNWISAHGGLYIVLFIIFAETGLFVGFFLPGDSLLFIAGVIIAGSAKNPTPFESIPLNLVYWISIISVAGIVGNMVGYWFGNKSGHLLMKRPDSFLFKKKNLEQAHEFYERKGGAAIILARFVPIVRTFAPIVAGIAEMNYKKFIMYNIIGCLAWVISMTMTGFLLGNNEWVLKHIDIIVVGMIVVTTAPVLFKMFFGKKKATA